MIRNIIFDIGCVLVAFDWENYLKSYGFTTEKEETISRALFGGPMWKELDRGVMSIPEIEDAFVAFAPQYRDDILQVFRKSGECIRQFDYAVPWICSLKERGYRIYYLSNYSDWMIGQTKAALSFLPYMDGGLFSYEAKLIKPDLKIYQALTARYPSILPEESIFLDDSPENINAARSFGMHGIVFESKGQAEAKLEELLKQK